MQRLVAEHLKRSAVTAYEAHPRSLKDDQTTATVGIDLSSATAPAVEAASPHAVPVWGIISHPGWSSPSSIDLPNLHYDPVIIELPHLIEAKAVSLAPPDPLSTLFPNNENEPSDPPLPDALAVELLQRPASMGLRDYVSHLTSLAMIHPPTLGGSFLALYEKARFSGRPLDEAEFRALMHVFAEILRGMTVLSLDIVAELRAEEEREEEETWSDRIRSDIDADDGDSLRTSATVEYTPCPDVYVSESTSSSISSSSRSFHPRPSPRRRTTSSPPPSRTYHRGNNEAPSPSPLERSFSRQRSGVVRPPSVASMWSQASSQRSGGSVIHLSEARGTLDLPYTIVTKSSRELS